MSTYTMRNFTQILEPYIFGYTSTRADGAVIEFFRCSENNWTTHIIYPDGQRRAIEPGAPFAKARAAANKALKAVK